MNIKAIAKRLSQKHKTNNPFSIAEAMGIIVLFCSLKTTFGRYTKYCRIKSIIINSNADESLRKFICAHELAHAILHPNLNTAQLKHISPYANTNKYENAANTFAVELLLPDEEIIEHPEWTDDFFAVNAGIPREMIKLKEFPNVQMRIDW